MLLGYARVSTDDDLHIRFIRLAEERIGLAALFALGPTLDALYQEAASASFTAIELGIRS